MTAESNGEDDSRESGVDIGDLDDRLEGLEYPIETDELLDRYGDEEIVLPDETKSLSQVLDGMNDTYHDPEEVRQAIYTMVGDEAVGRKGYSDRGGIEYNEDEGNTESF